MQFYKFSLDTKNPKVDLVAKCHDNAGGAEFEAKVTKQSNGNIDITI